MPDILPPHGATIDSQSGMYKTTFDGVPGVTDYYTLSPSRDGLDLHFFIDKFGKAISDIEQSIVETVSNANMTDIQKQMDLQRLGTSYEGAVSTATAFIKLIGELNKEIGRNIA